MGLGVLGTKTPGAIVPGTVILAQDTTEDNQTTNAFKHGTGRHRDILLNPQPSDDPNDPLNWPYYQKLVIIVVIVFGASLCAAVTGPLLNASLFVLATEFKRPIANFTILSGYQLLVGGASGPIVSAAARKYGKRPTFLFSSLFCLIGTIIGSASTTYNTLLAGRIIQGLSIAAYESLVYTMVGDLFFVHERGLYTAVMSFVLTCVGNLCSVVSGRITNDLGWHYLFHILNACLGLQLLLTFFFVPETCYIRNPTMSAALQVNDQGEKNVVESGEITQIETRQSSQRPRKSYWQSLAIFTGTYTDEDLLRLVVAPFISCTNIVALWTVITTGVVLSYYVAVAFVIAQLFSPPPYLLTVAQVGYVSLGPFIGGVLGCVLVGLLLDPLTIWLSKRNGGVYEPEFRLPLVAIGLLCGGGLFAFGGVAAAQGNIYLISFLWGLTLFGIAFVVGPCSAYAIDAYRSISDEVFIANIMFKNFLFYGYSYFVNDWTARSGPGPIFYTFGGISFGLVLSTAIVYVFGKRYRAFWNRHNVMDKLGMEGRAGT
ncbi:MFS general substrate transporter [Setomelanomma holmii]|uniref:MFS general substrate transporter n=1 Tax=Setomelanomma holmii TaxID=210430 RepID=A0A9P4H586_9PLEO|nr:MFS general substrate transporter [Setomelanomma holmii]